MVINEKLLAGTAKTAKQYQKNEHRLVFLRPGSRRAETLVGLMGKVSY